MYENILCEQCEDTKVVAEDRSVFPIWEGGGKIYETPKREYVDIGEDDQTYIGCGTKTYNRCNHELTKDFRLTLHDLKLNIWLKLNLSKTMSGVQMK